MLHSALNLALIIAMVLSLLLPTGAIQAQTPPPTINEETPVVVVEPSVTPTLSDNLPDSE